MSRSSVFSQAKDRLKSLFGGGKEREQSRLEEEIQSIIDEGEEKGLLDEKSGEMIQSILEFRETVAREVMVPRTDIVAVPGNAPIADIIEQVNRHGYSRITQACKAAGGDLALLRRMLDAEFGAPQTKASS